MMKKDIIYVAMGVALATISLAGCTHFEEDDLFEENSSLRIEHFNKDLQSRLVEQSSGDNYGWVIQYFVSGTDEMDFEGFNLLGRFYDNGKVTLASNHHYLRNGNSDKYTEHSSTYEMLKEEGPVLSFNTWNDILTVFVDPVDPSNAPATIISDGEGMGGDQNLVFHGFDDDCIIFHGQRHSAKVRFVPCDRPWETYLSDVEATKNHITNNTVTSYYVVSGTDTLYFKNLHSGVITYCERINDPLFPSTINCIFTPKGFYLQHRNSIGGTTFQEFKLSDDDTCLMSENDSVQVYATWDNYIISHSSVWEMDAELFTEQQQSLFDQISNEVASLNSKWKLKSLGIGRSTGKNPVNGLVLTYYTKWPNTDAKNTNTAGLELTLTKPKTKQMRVDCTEGNAIDNNLSVFTNRGTAIEALMREFASTLKGTYDMTPNDYFLPTSVHCTSVDGGMEFTIGN